MFADLRTGDRPARAEFGTTGLPLASSGLRFERTIVAIATWDSSPFSQWCAWIGRYGGGRAALDQFQASFFSCTRARGNRGPGHRHGPTSGDLPSGFSSIIATGFSWCSRAPGAQSSSSPHDAAAPGSLTPSESWF